ncbi:MAG: hypothetical protein NXI18_13140 [Alphaproteobacteria bacterium]|nr:hypothetical protein [Alphaproteobacteria bacterium]
MTRRFGKIDDIAFCGPSATCRQAVVRTYSDLCAKGVDDVAAFRAATRVYTWHHPEVPVDRVPFVIADWLP